MNAALKNLFCNLTFTIIKISNGNFYAGQNPSSFIGKHGRNPKNVLP
jgi:hypothetical protein